MQCDVLIRGGTVYDGSGAPGMLADVAIAQGRLLAIGTDLGATARRVIDASGMVVAPGFIDTYMTRALSDVQREALLGNIPAGRLGEVADIPAAVAFLASPAAGYITGETLHVNGGMYMA